MSFAVIAIATILVFILLGYRLDRTSGQIEQSGLLQFDSSPTGASVSIDGRAMGSSTPTKTSLSPGAHNISVSRDGYETWSRDVNVVSGTLLWLDYIRLVPKTLNVETVATYGSLSSTLTSPDNKHLLIQKSATDSSFDLMDISGDTTSIKVITLPTAISTELAKTTDRNISLVSWDEGSRYVILKSTSSAKTEWLVLDTRSPENSKNASSLLDIAIDDLKFLGTSGNVFYALSGGDVRKLDLSSATISRSLVTSVKSFSVYSGDTLSYVATKQDATGTNQVVGIYRDGDDAPTVLDEAALAVVPFNIAITSFHNEDYVAVLKSTSINISYGNFPPSGSVASDNLKVYETINGENAVTSISFSPAGDFLLLSYGSSYKTYAIEYDQLSGVFSVSTDATASYRLRWLDAYHIATDYLGGFIMRDFDGTNVHEILKVTPGFDMTMSSSERYMYGVLKTDAGYQINRVKIIL